MTSFDITSFFPEERGKSKDMSRIIFAAVQEGLWPFKAEHIDLEMSYDIDFNVHWLYAEARGGGWNYWRVAHKEILNEENLAYPYSEAVRLSPLFRDAFRYRDTIPNHHGHHLGEE